MIRVLVVDDDPGLRQSLGLLLTDAGYAVTAESSPERALGRALEPGAGFDLILCDVRMPDMDGLSFLRTYRARGGSSLVIMMSAYGGEAAALDAMKEGAYDYIPKPFRPDEVVLTLKKAEERERLRREVAALKAELGGATVRDVVAEGPAMRRVLALAERVAATATTVLLSGESGTGKEVLARAIHRLSPRADRPFVAVNCAAIPEPLLESELFGHVRGAFTGALQDRPGLFEAAHGGTLLLDEIGELPLGLQAKLLRVLQENEIRRVGDQKDRPVDVRVLAATARDLAAEVQAGQFREDLFYRLNVVAITLPPLRDRKEDVPALAALFARQAAARVGHTVRLTPEAVAWLAAQPWPGNVRELQNAIERAAVLSPSETLRPDDLRGVPLVAPSPPGEEQGAGRATLREAVEAAERQAMRAALQASTGNRREAARRLGISLRTLFYKLERYGLG